MPHIGYDRTFYNALMLEKKKYEEEEKSKKDFKILPETARFSGVFSHRRVDAIPHQAGQVRVRSVSVYLKIVGKKVS